MRKVILVFLFILMIGGSFQSLAQCAMCRRTAETGMTEDVKKGRGLNTGILYLLSIPYIMGGIGLFAWYRSRKKD